MRPSVGLQGGFSFVSSCPVILFLFCEERRGGGGGGGRGRGKRARVGREGKKQRNAHVPAGTAIAMSVSTSALPRAGIVVSLAAYRS